jgi:hypothetical protein
MRELRPLLMDGQDIFHIHEVMIKSRHEKFRFSFAKSSGIGSHSLQDSKDAPSGAFAGGESQGSRSQPRFVYFLMSLAGVLLFITATAKLISSFGSARILGVADPILGLQFRYLFVLAGMAELIISFFCLVGPNMRLKANLVTWLATIFVIYRIGRLWLGYSKPCPCLGSLTGTLHVPPTIADTAMKIILAYLLIAGYGTLFWLWHQHRR